MEKDDDTRGKITTYASRSNVTNDANSHAPHPSTFPHDRPGGVRQRLQVAAVGTPPHVAVVMVVVVGPPLCRATS